MRYSALLLILIVLSCSEESKTDNSSSRMLDMVKAAKLITSQINPKALPRQYDTLIDLNSDGKEELLFEFYGLAGSGLKNGIMIYHYNVEKKEFIYNDIVTIANPTFYDEDSTIYGYYIANGGGYAEKFKWVGDSAIIIESYHIEIYLNNPFDVTYINYLTNEKDTFQWDTIDLPIRYQYWNYHPIIKNKQ